VALLLGVAVIGAVAVIATGFAAIDRDQKRVGTAQAERSLSQFDSQASDVAFGQSGSARVDVGLPDSEGTMSVRPDDGWIRVCLNNGAAGPPPGPGEPGPPPGPDGAGPPSDAGLAVGEPFADGDCSGPEVANVTLGAVLFQQGRATVGFQSGGVFRSNGNRSVLLSQPDLHYNDGTLTVPIVKIRGGAAVASVLQVTPDGTVRVFPDQTRGLTNKVDDTTITLTVKSRYYKAWGEYFANQFPGNVTVTDDSQTAKITLEPESEVEFMHVTIHQINVSSG